MSSEASEVNIIELVFEIATQKKLEWQRATIQNQIFDVAIVKSGDARFDVRRPYPFSSGQMYQIEVEFTGPHSKPSPGYVKEDPYNPSLNFVEGLRIVFPHTDYQKIDEALIKKAQEIHAKKELDAIELS